MDGGDKYCIEYTKHIRFDHTGPINNGETGTSALVFDFFETF